MEETSKVTKSRVHHGFNISIARNRKGLKQAALADMLGISQQRLSQLENQRGMCYTVASRSAAYAPQR